MASPARQSEPLVQATAQDARDVAEAAREDWAGRSLVAALFDGRLPLGLVHPFPRPDPVEEARARPFLDKLTAFLRDEVDSDAIDRDKKVPAAVIDGLRALGAFGIKIPRQYGGLGLSQHAYAEAIRLITSVDGSLTALLSAHQSIGVPQPLKLFGTEEQKARYFPRLAKGAVSAFALTEPGVGSDPAAMETMAVPTADGAAYVLNGEKLWCTNGTVAELFVVMARTPSKTVGGRERKQITAFIVERDWPGVEVVHRCEFMGLKGIENGVIRFKDVRVPRENVLWKEGQGLKLALITLNTGRLSLPAGSVGVGKRCLQIVRRWAQQRVQWGAPIAAHDAVAQKIAAMAANVFAMESVSEYCALISEREGFDIRLEAAMAKLYNSEAGWDIVDDTVQIRGGRGYETADSLAARGEPPIPVERIMRDFRINLIFEGSSEIMHLFIAREAVDHHLRVAGDLARPDAPLGRKAVAALRAALFYARWYPSRFLGWGFWPRFSGFGSLARHLRYVDRASRRLARSLFYAMVRFGPGLEKRQSVLFRLVDVGAELFAMTVTCARAEALRGSGRPEAEGAVATADLFCRQARRRAEERFAAVFHNDDARAYRLAQQVRQDEHVWLEDGIV